MKEIFVTRLKSLRILNDITLHGSFYFIKTFLTKLQETCGRDGHLKYERLENDAL